jgi:hypothetical protein
MSNRAKFESIEVKYRTWYKGIPPKPIKLEIPGWAGDSHGHKDGDRPMPWHCIPFVEASTYGLELLYPFAVECHVKNVGGKIVFEGDWDKEQPPNDVQFPPFLSFAPGHFGFTSSMDIEAPPGHIIRLEPHPRLYTDTTGTVPLAVAGHIQSEWWPKIFFVVFKSPLPGQEYIFREGEPYAQILILPRKVTYSVKEMSQQEKDVRLRRDHYISQHRTKIANHSWFDYLNNNFDDKYKVLSQIYAKEGVAGVDRFLEEINAKTHMETEEKKEIGRQKFKRKLIIRK